ncbi:hypothetical protein JOF55_004413 [Haloactinomyces albus]|uniref:Uncharacterized protein n=1 Tax=Haloactinomyces albus TaxID=1352928 RepID=A0AAE3ZG34_9ACTN|nr:hypothetical protein [Haloactinomyces albus]
MNADTLSEVIKLLLCRMKTFAADRTSDLSTTTDTPT